MRHAAIHATSVRDVASTMNPPRRGVLQRKCACGGMPGASGECADCRRKRERDRRGSVFQTKLKINEPGDKYEREADRVADQVMRAGDGASKRPAEDIVTGVRRSGTVKQCPSGRSTGTRNVPAFVRDGALSSGRPLEPATRGVFESRFGHDFSRVRLHTGTRAAKAADAVHARAFTVNGDIVFADGEYRPDSRRGRRLLAHELAHVVQQRAAPAAPSAEAFGDRTDSGAGQVALSSAPLGLVQREAGVDAADSWAALVTKTVNSTYKDAESIADEAVRRMLKTESGAALINGLWRKFCGKGRGCGTTITANFTDALGPKHQKDAGGFFEPDTVGASAYTVHIKNQRPPAADDRSVRLGGSWPGGTKIAIPYTHTDAASGMATTLYHELLHVLFLNTKLQTPYPTGHGDVQKGEIDPRFLRLLKKFYGEIDALEKKIKAEAKAKKQRPAPAPSSTPRPAPAPSAEPTPSPVGGEISIRLGGGGTGVEESGGAVSGVLGADLILKSLGSLRLGARGIYMTPGHLLVGGTVGYRALESESGRFPSRPVSNPLFFDIEAGIVAELTPTETDRITENFGVLISGGIGQEFGRKGTRFFWRAGGFVVISDKKTVGGGGTVGTGLRF